MILVQAFVCKVPVREMWMDQFVTEVQGPGVGGCNPAFLGPPCNGLFCNSKP